MSNIERVQAIYEAFGRGDVGAILERLHPDVAWDDDVVDHGIPWVRPRHGRGAVQAFFGELVALEFTRFEPLNFFAGGDQVVVTLRIEATVKATGKQVKDYEAHVFTFDAEGRVVRFRHLIDTHQHLSALRP